jgi:hypothetical protein
MVNAEGVAQTDGTGATFSQSKARSTPSLAPGSVGLQFFINGLRERGGDGKPPWGVVHGRPVTEIVDKCQPSVGTAGAEDRAAPWARAEALGWGFTAASRPLEGTTHARAERSAARQYWMRLNGCVASASVPWAMAMSIAAPARSGVMASCSASQRFVRATSIAC